MKVIDGTIASPLGFSADGLHAGFKKRKMDFGWIVSEKPASVAGVYTTNKVIAAPLIVTKTSVKKAGKMRAVVVNSGVSLFFFFMLLYFEGLDSWKDNV